MHPKIIKQVLLEQKQEIERIFKERIIDREVKTEAKKSMKSNLIKVITGPRRAGKSVLAHQLLKGKNYGYVNFDDERFVGIKTKDLNDFIEVLEEINPNFRYLLLDEVQNVYGWELFVNRLKRMGYNIIVTGSNSKLLSKELATHLTGRHIAIELFPFSFREFLDYKNITYSEEDFYIAVKKGRIKRLFHEYLIYGGFPETLKFEDKTQYLKDLYEKIITKDIILRFGIRYIKDLREMALYLLSNFASRLSYNKIKNIFNIKSVHTVKNYVSYLEEAYLIFQLYPFSFKVKNQILQLKKNYAIDTGLINTVAARISPDYGKFMENIVFLELLRKNREIYFYSDFQHHEIDFVIKQGFNTKQIIQVSYDIENPETKKREIRSLFKASHKLKCKDLLVITEDYEGEEKIEWQKTKRNVKFIPLWKWLLT